jgi:nucleotide-binding universal stress UspA family protein
MFTHILVPLDGSAFSETAVEPALSLGDKYRAKVSLFTVMLRIPESKLHVPVYDQQSEERGRQYLEEIRAAQSKASSVPIDIAVRFGTPAEGIEAFAREAQADLIVMSTHGTTGMERSRPTLGSTAWKLMHHAPCPILLITADHTEHTPN